MADPGKRQRTLHFTPEQDAWLVERSKRLGSSVNDAVRQVIESVRNPQRTTRTASVEVWLHDEDEARHYRRAEGVVEEDHYRGIHRLDIYRGEKRIASFDLNDVKHWDTGEADDAPERMS
jgi:hypothetical protein